MVARPGTTTTVLLIAGMHGSQCRERIAVALGSVAGVGAVDVNFYRARATVVHDTRCGSADLIRAVLKAGYGASPDPDMPRRKHATNGADDRGARA